MRRYLSWAVLLLATVSLSLRTPSEAAQEDFLTCTQIHRISLWAQKRYQAVHEISIRESTFIQRISERWFHKLDPHAVLFSSVEVENFAKQHEKAWENFLNSQNCSFYEAWFRKATKLASERFKKNVSSLSWKNPIKDSTGPGEDELIQRIQKLGFEQVRGTPSSILKLYGNQRVQFISDILEEMVIEPIPMEPLTLLVNSILSAIDPYSAYFSGAEYEDFYQDLVGRSVGLGIRVQKVLKGLLVQSVLDGSPAAPYLKPQDQIIEIEGMDLSSLPARKAKELLKGRENTLIHLRILRAGVPMVYTLRRRPFDLEESTIRVSYRKLPHPVAVIDIPSFYGRAGFSQMERSSAEELREILVRLKNRHQKISALLIDLRGNPGGYLEEAVEMAGFFLGNLPIVSVQEGNQQRILRGHSARAMYEGPLLVLIDEESASAAEVFAGALKDYGRAVILGSKRSFGKGSVQKLFQLQNEWLPFGMKGDMGAGVVKLTTSFFYNPSGHSPANGGINPHIVLMPNSSLQTLKVSNEMISIPDIAPILSSKELTEARKQQKILNERLAKIRLPDRTTDSFMKNKVPSFNTGDNDAIWKRALFITQSFLSAHSGASFTN